MNEARPPPTKFGYAVHATFIRLDGREIPWHVVLTSFLPPHDTKIVGLSAEGLRGFSHGDMDHNSRVDLFPRPDSMRPDYLFQCSDVKQELYRILADNFSGKDWCVTYVALDRPTYDLLIKVVDTFLDVELWTCARPIGECYTHTAATSFGRFRQLTYPDFPGPPRSPDRPALASTETCA